jgi:hypothetical protein
MPIAQQFTDAEKKHLLFIGKNGMNMSYEVSNDVRARI